MNPLVRYVAARLVVVAAVCLALTPALSLIPFGWWLGIGLVGSALLSHFTLKRHRDEMAVYLAGRIAGRSGRGPR